MFSDVGQAISAVAQGKADTTHFFNPATPASVAYIQIITGAINKWAQEGHPLWGKPLEQLAQSTAQNLITATREYYNLANTFGVPLGGHSEAIGHRDAAFARSRLNLFIRMNPGWAKPAPGSFPANTHTPYLQDLNDALLSGNIQNARGVINPMRVDLKLTPQQLRTSLRESVDAHRPIQTGKVGEAFIALGAARAPLR